MTLSDQALHDLALPLNPARVEALPAGHPAAGKPYLPGDDVIRRANEIFGFAGWSFSAGQPFALAQGDADGKGTVWAAMGRVTVGEASYEDMGTNTQSGWGAHAIEMSAKGAVTDAVKRCLTYLGDQFGLVLRDKDLTPEQLAAAWKGAQAPAPPQTSGDLVQVEIVLNASKNHSDATAILSRLLGVERVTKKAIGEYMIANGLIAPGLLARMAEERKRSGSQTASQPAQPAQGAKPAAETADAQYAWLPGLQALRKRDFVAVDNEAIGAVVDAKDVGLMAAIDRWIFANGPTDDVYGRARELLILAGKWRLDHLPAREPSGVAPAGGKSGSFSERVRGDGR